jgi:hypothetical protein
MIMSMVMEMDKYEDQVLHLEKKKEKNNIL